MQSLLRLILSQFANKIYEISFSQNLLEYWKLVPCRTYTKQCFYSMGLQYFNVSLKIGWYKFLWDVLKGIA